MHMSNKENYLEIDLLKCIPPNSYITINKEFKSKIFQTAFHKFGTRKNVSKMLDVSINTFDRWLYHKKKGRMPYDHLMKLLQLAGISVEELRNNLINIGVRSNVIFVKNWKLFLNEEFFEWLGMVRGDGHMSDRSVTFWNTYSKLCLFFVDVLRAYFGINKKQFYIQILIPLKMKIEDAEILTGELRKLGFLNIKLYKSDNTRKAKKIVVSFSTHNKILLYLLNQINREIKTYLYNSPREAKAAYIRGFCSAEGCISESKSGVRIITITQNNIEELEFIKSILTDLGIKNLDGPRSTGTAFRIGITTQRELEKFQKLIGFGKHDIKNNHLKEVLKHYKFNVYRIPHSERYTDILKTIKENNEVTAKFLAEKLSLDYSHTHSILSEMKEKGLVLVKQESYPYTYILGDKSA